MFYPAASWRVSDKCRKGGFMVRIKRILIAVTLIVALAVPSCAFAAEPGTTTEPGTETAVDDTDSPVGGDGLVIASSTGKEYNGKKPCFYVYKILANGFVERECITLNYVNVGSYKYTAFGKEMIYTISKGSGNSVKAKVSSKSYSYKKLKKRSYSFYIGAKGVKPGTLKTSYRSSSKYVSVSSSGKVTVKKRAKKGTYKVAVTVTNKNYKTVVKYITVRVR